MNEIKDIFKSHCGVKFDKFMESSYANEKGETELKFWQEKLV